MSPTMKYTLPMVTDWSCLVPTSSTKRVHDQWSGTVTYLTAENRHIKIKVEWKPHAMQTLTRNASHMKGADEDVLQPPKVLQTFKGATEEYAVQEAARLGALEVKIMGTFHDFTLGSGQKKASDDPLHITLDIRTAEWGSKKVHLYIPDNWEESSFLPKPLSSVVFVKDHSQIGDLRKTLTQDQINAIRAFYHPNLSCGGLPTWMEKGLHPKKTAENPHGVPNVVQITAHPNFQKIETRSKEFLNHVEVTKELPLLQREAILGKGFDNPGKYMYTQYSRIVKIEFGGKATDLKDVRMDYATGDFWTMKKNAAGKWEHVAPVGKKHPQPKKDAQPKKNAQPKKDAQPKKP